MALNSSQRIKGSREHKANWSKLEKQSIGLKPKEYY